MKVILNEDKPRTVIEQINADEISTIFEKNSKGSTNGKNVAATTKNAKKKTLAKALSLDVIWDYLRIIFKERYGRERLIIILFICIILVKRILPFGSCIKYSTLRNKSKWWT